MTDDELAREVCAELVSAANRELAGEHREHETALVCPECGRRWGCRCRRVVDGSFDLDD